jgi:hypothetical protein
MAKGSEAKKTYWVKLSRPVIQTAVFEVKAQSAEEATELAKADANLDAKWMGHFEADDYGYDVVGIWDEADLDEGKKKPDTSRDNRARYLLLGASFGDRLRLARKPTLV